MGGIRKMAGMALLVGAACASAHGEQFVVLDKEYVHTQWYHRWEFEKMEHGGDPQPSNWLSPVNYGNGGTLYIRIEVRSFRTPVVGDAGPARFLTLQYCLFQDAYKPEKHACGNLETRFEEPGIYYFQHRLPLSGFEHVIDFSRKLLAVMVRSSLE